MQSFHDEFWSNLLKRRRRTSLRQCDASGVGAGDHLRSPHAHVFSQHRLGPPGGAFRFTEHTWPTPRAISSSSQMLFELSHNLGLAWLLSKSQQVRMTAKGPRSATIGGWVARRRLRVGKNGAVRSWRASRGQHPADRCELRLREGVLSTMFEQPKTTQEGRFVSGHALRMGKPVVPSIWGFVSIYSRAISQDVPESTAHGRRPGCHRRQGTLGTGNIVSPRVDGAIKLDRAGRTLLRANAGDSVKAGPQVSSVRNHLADQANDLRQVVPRSCAIPVKRNWIPELRAAVQDQYSSWSGLPRFLVSGGAYVRKNGRTSSGGGGRWWMRNTECWPTVGIFRCGS